MNDSQALRAGRREWIGLAVLALPTFLVSIDVFVLLLALPHLSSDLDASSTEQLWITDIYGFLLAGFMITMGNVGDRIGRRKLLLIGATAFGAASVAAAFAVNAEMLIVSRALLGIAGSTLMPSTLSLITTMFKDAQQRGLAIGVWMVCFMAGATAGPLVGGVMLDAFWWGSVFLLGVPAMVLLLVTGPILLPEYRDTSVRAPLDLVSVGLSLLAILPFVYGLKEVAKDGWSAAPVAISLIGIVFGIIFVLRQRKLTSPLLDLRLFGNRSFSAALLGMFLGTLTTGAMMLFITQYFQLVAELSPFVAGLWMIPAMAGSIAGNMAAPLLARRYRPAYVIGLGLMVSVVGLLALTQAGADGALAPVVIGFALINLGAGPLVALATDLIVGSAPEEKAGSAASMSEVSGEFGYAIGVALIGSLGAWIYRDSITVPAGVPADAAAAAEDSLAGASDAASKLPDDVGASLLEPAQEAFASGFHVVAAVSAVLLVGIAITTAWLLRSVPPTGAQQEKDTAATQDDTAPVG
ncbi:MFS transporter [Actinomadura sp. KC06]|uniref:MFS transporter n=1 Tax=Actinomadura sp. KC06 TaxID=2530369 RepID=UPI0010456136|nr:MFS transporter [Actinomadura sp. KC06]TDD33900.1 MFS transporter [Actinomadura sp. KC06]